MNQVKHERAAPKAVGALLCPLCNSNNQHQFQVLYSREPVWEIVVCTHCSFTFIPGCYRHGRSTEYYQDDTVAKVVKQGNNWVKLQRQKLRLFFLKKFIRQGKILDIGAGWGHFLYAAGEEGFVTKGVERDSTASGYAREELGMDVIQSDFCELPESEKFDVITMWDVLEHLDDPVGVIAKCARLTNEEGFLLLQVPQIDSFFARLQKQQWIHLSLEHVNYFNKKTITDLLSQNGYEVLRIKSSFELKFVLTHSLAYRLRKKKRAPDHPGNKSKFFEDKAATPSEGATLFNKFTNMPQGLLWCFVRMHNIIYNLLSVLNIGEEMMVIARKKISAA